jgi:tetratricopeptide (TPR) repeat protein
MNRNWLKPGRALICLAFCLPAAIGAIVWYRDAKSSDEAAVLSVAGSTGGSVTDEMIARLTAKVKRNSEDDRTWEDLGTAVMQKAREAGGGAYYKHADTAFRKALSLNPKNVSATVGVSWVHGVLHEFEESIEWANKALALDPKNQEAYGLLGDAHAEMGDYQQAFTSYQKMLDIRPDLSSYSRAAHLLYLTGDVRKASWLMEKAISAGGSHTENIAWCRAQRALMFWGTGALLPAEQELDAAIKQAPNNHHVLAAMGKVKTARKDYSAAIDHYKRAIAIAPQPDWMIALGDLYKLTGQATEA